MISLTTINLADLRKNDLPVCLFAYEDAGFAAVKTMTPAALKALRELAKGETFKGSAGECCSVLFSDKGGQRRHVLVGLGPKKDAGTEAWRRAAGALYGYAKSRFAAMAVVTGAAQPVAEGLTLASYRFAEYKKQDAVKLAEVRLVLQSASEGGPCKKALARAALSCEAVAFARDLVNRGPSDKTPQSLAAAAESLKGAGVTLKLIDKKHAQELGMGSFLAVARGSAVDPVMIHLTYKPKGPAKKRKIGIIGKGITFDSGGLSLKPPQSMETMKMDMAGAAAVLGLFKILPRLAPKVEIHGICAVTYNMPGPDALKPGDVVKAMNGKTIEVLNTDAEGRLVLADALVYASRQGLNVLVDLATLTGAVVTALGSQVAGAMSNNPPLLKAVSAAAGRADEPICELPLVRDYKENIKSSIADLQNIGKARGEAGSIIGGLFLEEFVDGKPWVHLDIAGTAWADHDRPCCPKGGTGAGVRTLIEYLAAL
jgi:leucyl aminopeptidase